MGGEIAAAIASAGIPVVLKDVDQRYVDHGLEKAESLWQAQVDAGKLEPGELQRRLALIGGATDYDAFGDVDFASRRAGADGHQADRVRGARRATHGHAILASNTSSLPITEMGDATSRPEQVWAFTSSIRPR